MTPRAAASTGIVRAGSSKLRVVWTFMGVAFVSEDERGIKTEIERRIKMSLKEDRVPALIRDGLVKLACGAKDTDLPIDLTWARDYERDVLFAAMRIPWGETRPYRWLAREARRPLAVRAAASAIAKNPLWLIVPCHRIVRADGSIGQYGEGAKGVAKKRRLLAREGVLL